MIDTRLRVERDPEFWTAIAAHPALGRQLLGLDPAALGEAAQRPSILPLASANGGYLIGRMDGLGLAAEVHALFRPAGFGAEAYAAGVEATICAFANGFQVLIVQEVEGVAGSVAPRSFGFRTAGPWRPSPLGRVRAQVLTRAAWEASPAFRRACGRLN